MKLFLELYLFILEDRLYLVTLVVFIVVLLCAFVKAKDLEITYFIYICHVDVLLLLDL